jgi:glucose-1-phosphate thymidylyltransferase
MKVYFHNKNNTNHGDLTIASDPYPLIQYYYIKILFWEELLKKIKIAIPMAGFGTRMRPHTWSKPKPLVAVAGKTFFDYVLGQFDSLPKTFDPEFVFIVGPNQQDQIEAHMQKFYPEKTFQFVLQEEMLGQSHALFQAREHLRDYPMLMAFSDTLIETDLSMLKDEELQAGVWVKPVPDPRRFGVAVIRDDDTVVELVEKPDSIENNLAMVGFYYFSNGSDLIKAIEEQMEKNVTLKGEYFLADAVNLMLSHGVEMKVQRINVWLDAGIPAALLDTNRHLLEHGYANSGECECENLAIIPPVFIHPTAKIKSSVIGPHVSIGENCQIEDAIIRNSVLDADVEVRRAMMEESILGKQSQVVGKIAKLNLGDNSAINN